jgi:bile acid:Na+ symporter, BASS family
VITQALLPAALAFIMFAMGLTMSPGDFRLVFTRPKAMAVGLAAKIVLLPLTGLAVVAAFRPSPEFAVGLIILAACPAGVSSSLLTHLGGGRTALAAAITVLSSLAALATVPLLVNLALGTFAGYDHAVAVPVGRMVLGIFLVDTVPLVLGLAVQRLRPQLAATLGRAARPLATLLFAVIVVGAFASQKDTLLDNFATAVPPAAALNLLAMAVAWSAAAAFRLSLAERIAVVMETGLQNGALGIFVAVTLLGSQAMMVPSIVYALVMNVTALAFIARMRHKAARASVSVAHPL